MPGTNGLTLARSIKAESELAGGSLVLLSPSEVESIPEELKAAALTTVSLSRVKHHPLDSL